MTITEKRIEVNEADSASDSPTFTPTQSVSFTDIPIAHNPRSNVSTFTKILAQYTRNADTMELYSFEEKQGFQLKKNWTAVQNILRNEKFVTSSKSDRVHECVINRKDEKIFIDTLDFPLKISEFQCDNETQVRGHITTVEDENDFNDWFIYHILEQARLSASEVPLLPKETLEEKAYHGAFADFFAENLKNDVPGDQWEVSGRAYFIERVRYFTDRYLKIECILPAFPCKSSNRNKVYGEHPDKGEELALKRLIQATVDVKKIYPPGLKIWIVSDGHVFSDCIGVDDDKVDRYTNHLHELYKKCEIPGHDAIGFCGLNDLFFSGKSVDTFDKHWVEDVEIAYYTGSKILEDAHLSRQILMKACDTDDGRLREQINIPGHPRLTLFRGFSKFMTEDLQLLPYFQSFSRKKFKKTVSKIAFNMIKRNDAYSNLVELLFPHHLRVSIHAHKNSGPKFGIRVISKDQCRNVRSLEDIVEPKTDDLLHIPTPWHNCVVKVIQGDTDTDGEEKVEYFLIKSRIIHEALKQGKYEGQWIDTCFIKGEGGHFVLARNKVGEIGRA